MKLGLTNFAIFAGEFCASCKSMLGIDEEFVVEADGVTLVGLEVVL